MKSLKHLPTKPTFVRSVTRKPHIRMQHVNPDKDKKFNLENYIPDKNYLNYLKKKILLKDDIHTIQDLDNVLKDFYENYSLNLTEYGNLTHFLALVYHLKDKGVSSKNIDNIISWYKEEHSDFIYSELFEKNKFIGLMKNLYLLNPENHEKIFYNILKDFGFDKDFNQQLQSRELIVKTLAHYVQLSPSSIEDMSFFFRKLVGQKMNPKNIVEKILLFIYRKTQETIKDKPLPNKFYRGMTFEIPKSKKEIKIKGSRLSPSSLDKNISMNFLPSSSDDTKYFKNREEFKKMTGIEIKLPESYKKYININGEFITIEDTGNSYLIGYLMEFKPKYKGQIFSVLHDEYGNKLYQNITGKKPPEGFWLHGEKEWIIFM